MEKLNNSKTIAVVDKHGDLIEEQNYRNTPLAELFPDEDVILIQWIEDRNMYRPTSEELSEPIEHDGKIYHGCWAWGSSVKRGITFGLTHDFPAEVGTVKLVEDGQRVGRWLMSQGIFGGFTASELKIGVLPPHTQTKAGPVEDGFGYIKRSLVNQYARKERITLGQSRDNWSFWQRIPWDKVEEEMLPILSDSLVDASDPAKMLWASPHSFEQKKQLYDAEPAMIEHPFVAASLNRSAQSYFARMCTSVNLRGEYRTAGRANHLPDDLLAPARRLCDRRPVADRQQRQHPGGRAGVQPGRREAHPGHGSGPGQHIGEELQLEGQPGRRGR